jgi:hypothetical protein
VEAKGFILTYENHIEPGWKKGFFYKAGGHMKEDLSTLFIYKPQFGKAIHPIVPHCPTRRRQAGSRSINLRRP